MIVEQYRLILQHRIIDTENIYDISKLEPEKICEYNLCGWKFPSDVPESYIVRVLCERMEKEYDEEKVR